MRLAEDPAELAAALGDLPRWVETRSLLMSHASTLTIGKAGDGAVVLDPDFPFGAAIGRADRDLLQGALVDLPEEFELAVQLHALEDARAALPAWRAASVTLHAAPRPFRPDDHVPDGVMVSAPPDPGLLASLPDDVRRYAGAAHAVAVRLVDQAAVAVAAAGDVTETLWDVGIDTLPGHRRRGHASACFKGLAAYLAGEGRQPVWASEDGNIASARLATQLGFQPVDRLAILRPPA